MTLKLWVPIYFIYWQLSDIVQNILSIFNLCIENVEKNEHFEWDDIDDDELDQQLIDKQAKANKEKGQKQVSKEDDEDDDDNSDWSSSDQSETDKKKIKPVIIKKNEDIGNYLIKPNIKYRDLSWFHKIAYKNLIDLNLQLISLKVNFLNKRYFIKLNCF